MRYDSITRMIQVCLDIANLSDEHGEKDERILDELGLGYRALSGILRMGCKDVIDLQNSYHAAVAAKNIAKIGEDEAHDFLEEVFGDREPYTINETDKNRIKAFVKSIMDEWDAKEGSEE